MKLCGHPPSDWNAELFTPSYASNGQGDSVDLRSIMKEKYNTCNNESQRHIYGDHQLLIELDERGDAWHLSDAAWQCQLLPEGHIVQNTLTEDFYMVWAVA